MDRDHRKSRLDVVDVALGLGSPELEAQLQADPQLALQLAQYRKIVSSLKLSVVDVPLDWVQRAVALGAPVPARPGQAALWRFLQPTAAFRGVATSERHAWIAAPGVDLRLMASQELNGYRILGHAKGHVDGIRSAGLPVSIVEGRFELFVSELDEAALEVVVDGQGLTCPPMTAVFGNGNSDSV